MSIRPETLVSHPNINHGRSPDGNKRELPVVTPSGQESGIVHPIGNPEPDPKVADLIRYLRRPPKPKLRGRSRNYR